MIVMIIIIYLCLILCLFALVAIREFKGVLCCLILGLRCLRDLVLRFISVQVVMAVKVAKVIEVVLSRASFITFKGSINQFIM